MIYYLLYYGAERIVFQKHDFEALLAQARNRNALLGITGKLIYCEGTFIQLLEGGEQQVKALYNCIEKDPRLLAAKIVAYGYQEKRYFKDWSMDFEKISLDAINEFENCTHPNVADYLNKSPSIKLLKLLVK